MNDFSNPKCYANKLGNCSNKISREHYISNNLLEKFEHNKTVKLSGLKWIREETFNLMSRNALASNILCTKHNAELSPLHSEVGKLFQYLLDYDNDFNSQRPANDRRIIQGDLIEKWMLKTVVGLIASKQIVDKSTNQSVKLKDMYVNILFNDLKFPQSWGMYFKVPDSNTIYKFDFLSVLPLIGNSEIKLTEFLINNFKFNLVLGNPDDPTFWGFYRINEIIFSQNTIQKVIEFLWNEGNQGKSINLIRTGTTKNFPFEWEDWMKK